MFDAVREIDLSFGKFGKEQIWIHTGFRGEYAFSLDVSPQQHAHSYCSGNTGLGALKEL